MRRISEEMVERIINLYASGRTYIQIHEETKISVPTIGKIIRNRPDLDRTHVGGKVSKSIRILPDEKYKPDSILIGVYFETVDNHDISTQNCRIIGKCDNNGRIVTYLDNVQDALYCLKALLADLNNAE